MLVISVLRVPDDVVVLVSLVLVLFVTLRERQFALKKKFLFEEFASWCQGFGFMFG